MNSQAHTETFCAQKTPSAGITRAAERYLEQYGDPIVMNTYLKITILVLAAVCLILGFLIFRSQKDPLFVTQNKLGEKVVTLVRAPRLHCFPANSTSPHSIYTKSSRR